MKLRNLAALRGCSWQVKTGDDQYGNPLDLISRGGRGFSCTLVVPGGSPKESLHVRHPQA